jgi:hypothetical protein
VQVMSARDWPSNHRKIVAFQVFDFEYLHIRRDNLGLSPTLEKGMNVIPLDLGVDKLARTAMAKASCKPNCLLAVQCPAETFNSPAKADAPPDRKRRRHAFEAGSFLGGHA